MRSVFVNQSVLSQAAALRRKLWLALIPLSPSLIVVFLDQDPEAFTAYTGLTFWEAFAIAATFAIAGVWYARKVWRCPVCTRYLGNDIFTKFCPHCATYVAIPKSVTPAYTDDASLYQGAALVPEDELRLMEHEEKQKNLIKRYRLQIILSIALTILIGGIAVLSDIQQDRVENNFHFTFATVQMIILTLGGTFSYCWCCFFLFYLDESVLSRYNNGFTRVVMGIYNIDIIKVIMTLLGGALITFVTVGLFGLWRFFRVRSKLKLLTSGTGSQVSPAEVASK